MTKFRITFTVEDDHSITDCYIESTKGCPQCDAGASEAGHRAGQHAEGVALVDEAAEKSTSSTKSGPAEAVSDSRL